jgi:AAA+ superfamily predicted ATPase
MTELFEDVINYPDPVAQRRLARLVGLDDVIDQVVKEVRIQLDPGLLDQWTNKVYGAKLPIVGLFRDRYPFFIFAGDVGTGKTVLAETFGDRVARDEDIVVQLYRLSLSARGTGAVGQMTQLLAAAFDEVYQAAKQAESHGGRPRAATMLLIDEADALAQSREFTQMHHEDRAGVNALIRGVDKLAATHVPAVVVMCTNRLGALDPAVRRRAARVFEFVRPSFERRRQVFTAALEGAGFTAEQIESIAEATGEAEGRVYPYSYSDLYQRLLPTLVLDSFPDGRLSFERTMELVAEIAPTPPFNSE